MGIGYISGQALMQGAKGGIDNQSLINGFIVISNKNETLGDTISTNNFIKGCPHRSIHSCPL
jgi:hypothetical protein